MPPFSALSGGPDALQIIDPVLTNVAVQFRPHGFVYDEIVAPQQVSKNIGQYPVFDLAGFFASGEDMEVADNAATPEVDFRYGMDFYHCKNYRRKVRITREEYDQVHPAVRLETSKVLGLLGIMAGNREMRLASKLRAQANGGDLVTEATTPIVKWDKGTSGSKATIEEDMKAAARKVYKLTGWRPNCAIFPRVIAEAIIKDPDIRELIRYMVGFDILAKSDLILPPTLFGFKTIVVDGALNNTAPQGAAEASLSEIWGNSVRMAYIDTNAGWGIPTTAYSFRGNIGEGFKAATPSIVTQDEPMGGYSFAVVDRWTEPDPLANNIRAWEKVDEKIVAPSLAIEIESVLENP